jgi:hypothetical protein
LEHLDVVERLLEHQQAVGLADLPDHFLPGRIRVSRADDHLQFRGFFPKADDRLDSIPSRWLSHFDKRHRIRLARRRRRLNFSQSFLTLQRGVHKERRRLNIRLLVLPIAAKDFSDVLMDRRIVVNDQNAIISGTIGRIHDSVFSRMAGRSDIKTQSRPGHGSTPKLPQPQNRANSDAHGLYRVPRAIHQTSRHSHHATSSYRVTNQALSFDWQAVWGARELGGK